MKQFLVSVALAAAMAGSAQGTLPAEQQVSDARAATAAAGPAKSASPRQLSPEQRAELRRQLYQYSRLRGKGS